MPDIGKLLWPKTVAVVGASSDTSGLRGRILEVILSHPFAGKVYPVSRSATEVQGLKAYASVDELPEPADLAILIVPAQYIPAELERCGTRRRQGSRHSLVRLCRGAGRGRPAHADRNRRHRAALRHGGERAQHRGLRQHRSRAVPDLQPGDGQEGRRDPPRARARQRPGLGDFAKRRGRLCLLRPRPAAQSRVPPHRHHRQRSRARCRRRARLHARRRRNRRFPAAARGREVAGEIQARGRRRRSGSASR